MSWRNIIALDGNSTAGAKVTFGNVAGIAMLLAIVVGAFMLLHELLLFVAVGAREVNKDIISNTESIIHKNTHTVDALSVDFVVTGMSGCPALLHRTNQQCCHFLTPTPVWCTRSKNP